MICLQTINLIPKNTLSAVFGLLHNKTLTMLIIIIPGAHIPPFACLHLITIKSLKPAMHLMKPNYYVMSFTAHAVSTFISAISTA